MKFYSYFYRIIMKINSPKGTKRAKGKRTATIYNPAVFKLGKALDEFRASL